MLSVLLFGVVGGGGSGHPTAADTAGNEAFWAAVPRTDADRALLANRARHIDVCALISRDALSHVGAVHAVDNTSPSTCAAHLGSAEEDKGTSVRWAGHISPKPFEGNGTRQSVGVVNYLYTADRDHLPADQADKLVQRSCTATARFASGATLMMNIDAPLGTEPCPIAQRLLPDAMRKWTTEPAQGTSPDTVRTVLLDGDPCAVLTKLGTAASQVTRNLWECEFHYHDQDVTLTYQYEQQQIVTSDSTSIRDGSHTIYRPNPGPTPDEYVVYNSPVGTAIKTETPTDYMGPYVPNLNVSAKSGVVAEDVMRQALSLFP